MTPDFTHFPGVSSVVFEQLNAGWVFGRKVIDKTLHCKIGVVLHRFVSTFLASFSSRLDLVSLIDKTANVKSTQMNSLFVVFKVVFIIFKCFQKNHCVSSNLKPKINITQLLYNYSILILRIT